MKLDLLLFIALLILLPNKTIMTSLMVCVVGFVVQNRFHLYAPHRKWPKLNYSRSLDKLDPAHRQWRRLICAGAATRALPSIVSIHLLLVCLALSFEFTAKCLRDIFNGGNRNSTFMHNIRSKNIRRIKFMY